MFISSEHMTKKTKNNHEYKRIKQTIDFYTGTCSYEDVQEYEKNTKIKYIFSHYSIWFSFMCIHKILMFSA